MSGFKDTTKRDRTPYLGQVRKWITGAYTDEEWKEAFRKHLTWKEKIDALIKVQPREIHGDSSVVVSLVLEGIKRKEIPIQTIDHKALEGHDDSDE